MATEVSCGQCQGRLLVETLGVVVACPHCGTHLSIPAPEPVPPPVAPEPPAPQFAAAPEPTPIPEPVYTPTPVVEPPPTPVLEFPVAAPPENHQPASTVAVTTEPPIPESIPVQEAPPQPVMFTAPLLEPETLAGPPADWAPPAVPEWTAPVEPAPPMPVGATELQLSSTQQFSLGAIAVEAAKSTPHLAVPDFAAASATAPQLAPISFGTAPGPAPAPAPISFDFGATPVAPAAPTVAAAPPASTPPMTFGTAPAAPAPMTFGAPSASPAPSFNFDMGSSAAPRSVTSGAAPSAATSSFAEPVTYGSPAEVLTTSVAEDGPTFADSELLKRQKFLFTVLVVVGSYASCMTIVVLYLLIRGQASNLESLPDLAPPRGDNGQLSWRYNPPKNSVASGHVLSLGQSRRFGSVNVTPLKVTRGSVKFEHFLGEAGMTREPTPPVLKLWIKFENVSRNQKFAPVDPYLLFTRKSGGMGDPIQANSFIATLENQRKGTPDSNIFEMSKESEFRMVGQNLSVDLEPGEKLETFIPSDEEATSLSGDLVWRVQFRKGYNPSSKRGVTTLIDVRFNSRDVKDERGA
jgi:hypothetical protein